MNFVLHTCFYSYLIATLLWMIAARVIVNGNEADCQRSQLFAKRGLMGAGERC